MSSESGAAHEPSEEPHDEEETPAGPSKECQSVLPPKPTSPVNWEFKDQLKMMWPTQTSRLEIADWERTKADLLYYKGDILTLWMYLSELFGRHNQNELMSMSKLSTAPHLVYLLLRHIECSLLIRKMTSSSIKASIKLEDLLSRLGHIIHAESIDPEHRTRALLFHISEMCNWYSDRVEDLNGGPVAPAIKLQAIELSREAVQIHEENATSNGTAVMYVHAMVRRSLKLPQAQENWVKACGDLKLLDRDDLFFSLKALTQHLFRAITSKDPIAVRSCLPALEETLGLGEWGKIFYDKWWKAEEQKLIKSDLWMKACNREFSNLRTPVAGQSAPSISTSSQSASPTSPKSPQQVRRKPTPSIRSFSSGHYPNDGVSW